jgi:hypothetical protein
MAMPTNVLSPKLQAFVGRQRMFFVATAPRDGHVNVSPKGLDTFRILDERRVAYLDLTGSGNETGAHVHENGRITLMFMALTGPPQILRLYGTARVVQPGQAQWDEHIARFTALPGTRQIFVIELDRVATSCGFGVPLYDYQGERSRLIEWAEQQGPERLDEYRRRHNVLSIDGKPTGFEHV